MFLRQLDLTTALRPSLYDGESLLFVQNNVGLYEGKFKLERYQNGSAYLTSHRICYVDNEEPRKYAVAIDLKDIERTEYYAGFLKSSPKITLFPKSIRTASQSNRRSIALHATSGTSPPSLWTGSPSPSFTSSPATTRDVSATWVCPVCGLPNRVPANFDPSTANQHTPLPPCQACGVKPPLVLLVKTSIAAMSNRTAGPVSDHGSNAINDIHKGRNNIDSHFHQLASDSNATRQCPRCTFENHGSLNTCEVCGAKLVSRPLSGMFNTQRSESPGPIVDGTIVGNESIESIRLSFREGGEKTFLERLKGALVQREWLLQSAPPVPRPQQSFAPVSSNSGMAAADFGRPTTPEQRVVGIAGLERRGAALRQNNQAVIGTAFEDLESLMISAKEVIAMAEQFARQIDSGTEGDAEAARTLLSDNASALGLVTTRDMLGSSSTSQTLYITELSRNLAEFLTDDRRGILRREGGIMSLVDLWAVFNRTRNGIELVSPSDCERAAKMWESLHMPIRLRRFKSGLLVVQEKSRTDEKTIASLLAWLRESQFVFPPPQESDLVSRIFGRGVTAQEAAEKFGWSIGIATEELEMAEETGVLCREQSLYGTKFWENHFMREFVEPEAALSEQIENLSIMIR